LTDAALLVVDARRSRRDAVVRARDTLSRAGARIAGVVLNRVAGDIEVSAYYTDQRRRSNQPEAATPTKAG
jgi:Mrp family chromosome partitioning ATPase